MQSVVLNSGLNKLNTIPLNRSVAVKKTNIDKIINECNIPLQIKNDNQKKMNEINENINFLHIHDVLLQSCTFHKYYTKCL